LQTSNKMVTLGQFRLTGGSRKTNVPSHRADGHRKASVLDVFLGSDLVDGGKLYDPKGN
jgi:hypothetical protein